MASTTDETLAAIATALQNPDLSSEEKNRQIAKLLPESVLKAHAKPSPSLTYINGTSDLTATEKLVLITENLQEVLDQSIIEKVLNEGKRPLRIYWGTAPTGPPHCAYFVAMLKIASYLKAGCEVTILLADLHGFLDNIGAASLEQVGYRAKYYRYVIVEILKAIGVPIDRLRFVLGSSYQLSENYQKDLLKLCTIVTMHDAKKAGAEVVKQVENATLSGLIYPLMQSLDEQYLGVDCQFGGVDQRKIFTLAKDILPKLKYKQRAHLMNPMVPGLAGGKMSASDPNSKIDVLDKPDVIRRKISKAFCVEGEVEGNGLISFIQYVLLPASGLRTGALRFVIERQDAEPLVYSDIEEVKKDYIDKIITPQLLKAAVSDTLINLLTTVRAAYDATPDWQEALVKAGYEKAPEVKEKPKKTPKNKGSKYPGAAKVEANPENENARPDLEADLDELSVATKTPENS